MEVPHWLSGIVSAWCQLLPVNCKFCAHSCTDGWSNWSPAFMDHCVTGRKHRRLDWGTVFDQRLKSNDMRAQVITMSSSNCPVRLHFRAEWSSVDLTSVTLMTHRIVFHGINSWCALRQGLVFPKECYKCNVILHFHINFELEEYTWFSQGWKSNNSSQQIKICCGKMHFNFVIVHLCAVLAPSQLLTALIHVPAGSPTTSRHLCDPWQNARVLCPPARGVRRVASALNAVSQAVVSYYS